MPEPAKDSKGEAPRKTRIELLPEWKEAYMPPLEPDFAYLVDTLLEIGPAVPNGMGVTAISWRDLQAWCEMTGIDLDPWESRLLRRLSAAYVNESRRAEDPKAEPPWDVDLLPDVPMDPATKHQAAMSMREATRALALP